MYVEFCATIDHSLKSTEPVSLHNCMDTGKTCVRGPSRNKTAQDSESLLDIPGNLGFQIRFQI